MQTENEIIEPRDINKLLALDTYQGMTDEEINSIIEYKAERLYKNKEIESKRKIEREQNNEKLSILRDSCKKTEEMLQSILNREVPIKSVGDV